MLDQLTRRKDTTAGRSVAPLRIRRATPSDAGAVERLAQLDSSRTPTGDVLVAEVGSELWAALSLDDFHAVSDPMRPSGDTVWILAERGRQLKRAARAPRRRQLRLRLA
jgi:hypothetical protein